MTNLPKIWPSSGSENQQRASILRMLNELGIDTSDAPEIGSLKEYAAKKEQQNWEAHTAAESASLNLEPKKICSVYETGQRLAKLETAQEILTALGSTRSGWIFEEKKKPAPDAQKIQQWKLEREGLANLRDSLTMGDMTQLQATINIYGPQLKELLAPNASKQQQK